MSWPENWFTIYSGVLWVLLIGGIIPAAYFCLTWTPGASRARLGLLLFMDIAGWVWLGLLLMLLSLITGLTAGWTEPETPVEGLRRVLTQVFVDLIVLVRAARWHTFRRARMTALHREQDDVRSASRRHHNPEMTMKESKNNER